MPLTLLELQCIPTVAASFSICQLELCAQPNECVSSHTKVSSFERYPASNSVNHQRDQAHQISTEPFPTPIASIEYP